MEHTSLLSVIPRWPPRPLEFTIIVMYVVSTALITYLVELPVISNRDSARSLGDTHGTAHYPSGVLDSMKLRSVTCALWSWPVNRVILMPKIRPILIVAPWESIDA
ncbi:hypothetical protein FA95DRAFT_1312419 [Auriscalpium vulgare]|uniref:Uncharacterized protein n=1 Tax=Auriscalpium vulgare TaxID=40419 RepID=A0ACB8RS82_9AGAM|nr:hypothetical protein FA95DRAFT_1312419 [Auriscalpium vulgare]